MKRLTTISSVLASLLASATLHALPQKWEADLGAQPPQVYTLQRPRGETYELEAVLKDHGKPFAPAITNARIYWQTNGMENLYWSAPASVSNNVLRATWLPSMDPGSTTVRGYIGDPGHIYAAAFQFRFISSPGATPNELPLPQKVIDFAKVTVLNPPWSGGGGGGGGVDTNAVKSIINSEVGGTNAVKAAVTAIPTLQSDVSALSSSVSDIQLSKADRANTLEGYGIEDGATKDDLEDYLPLTGGVVSGNFSVEVTDGGFSVRNGNAGIGINADSGSAEGAALTLRQTYNGYASLYADDTYSGLTISSGSKSSSIVSIAVIPSEGTASISVNGDPEYETTGSIKKDGKEVATEEQVAAKQDALPYPTNAIPASVITGLEPPSSPTIRLYDEVRQCWWIGRMVNGVINWEVE